jgi:hypothetical protein
MEIAPSMKSLRFEELDPGELFFMNDGSEYHVALAVRDPNSVKNPSARDKMTLLLGPPSSNFKKVPTLTSIVQRTPVVSFGKNYILQLPSDRRLWSATEPSPDARCLVLAGEKACMRAHFPGYGQPPGVQCYIDVKSGELIADKNGRFAYPDGECAYTSDWIFLTAENDARKIFSSDD